MATIQMEQRLLAENGPPCRGVDSVLEKKPEFASLRNTVFCKQTVEVQTVAITSDYSRDVVFKIFTMYDIANVKLWLKSWESLLKRLDGIGFIASQSGSGSGCQAWKYILVDPVDGQTFQGDDAKAETEAGCDYATSTKRYAESRARVIRLTAGLDDSTVTASSWSYEFEIKHKHLQKVLDQPVEVSSTLVAHFQRFDDGWRFTGY